MYQVLYRKWRPKTFSDVSGQEHITTTLLNELSTNRLNHAYLFTGSRGTGKTTCAKILAKAVNCLHPVNGNPCGECEICKGIDSGGILDVTEMDAASNRKIDDIRQIIDEVQFKPSKCKYRVYIIDEVHMLTTEAFNALLKTLEEPHDHAIFILATTQIHKLPQPLLSRCQRFDFHRIPPRAIADRLLYVASQEGVTLSDGAALLAASVADGALRDALSLLDRCIAISSDIDEDVVRSAAGLARKTYLFELANCVINKNTAKALEIVNRLYGESKDMARLCDELLSHFRTLMLIKSVKNPRDIIIIADDEFEQAQVQSDYLSLADIVYYMDVLSRAYQNMGRGTGDRTELEMAVVKLSSAELDGTVEALTARVTALEKAVKKGIRVNCVPEQVQAVSQPVQSEPPKPEVQKSEPEKVQEVKPVVETEKDEPVAPTTKIQGQPAQEQPVLTASAPKKAVQRQSVDLDAIYNNAQPFPDWAEVVNNMKPVSRAIAAAFANSSAYTSGKYMLIDTDNEMAFELLKNNERRQEIRQLIFETTGQHYNLGPYKRPSAKQEDKTDHDDRLVDSLQGSDVIISLK